ncbi:conserved exported hypothetical protein [Planktothrix sp. PCC 11201]|uniref:hypothetical protein n=1 Tax=Planktothrix sp. PCC 11201 TaxID=1729650 RepID=UPI000910A63D|nr:hypothetical protein [Planktothrix sp. PCC 11201]SKB15006.1 conserved exported hypothetical protein [Planktothrix sp. PCC 11201]
MKSTLSSCFSLLTILVATPAWASAVNLDSDPTVSSAFSEDQHQFLINSDRHFPVDQYPLEFNPVAVEKMAIAPSPSQQLTEKNAEDYKLSQLSSTFLNHSINAADLQSPELRTINYAIAPETTIPNPPNIEGNTLSQNPNNIVNEFLAEDTPSSTPETEQPTKKPGWRFEVEPMLFVPFNIQGYAIVGEGASVNRVVLVDLITAEITNRILNQLPKDIIEQTVNRVLERLPFDRSNTRLEDRIAQGVRDRLKQRGEDLTARLETQIREGVQTIVNRVPYGQVPIQVDFNLGIGKMLDLNFTRLLQLGTRLEAWNGDIGLIFQGVYTEIGLTNKGSQIDIDFDTELLTSEILLAWHLGTLPLTSVKDTSKPNNVYPSLDFEVYGGTRFGYLDTNFKFNPGPEINYRPDWFDPALGAQITLNLADNLKITTRGGTAITGGSEAQANWDLLVALDWQISRDLTLSTGYRLYQLKVEKEGNIGTSTVKMTSQGMRLGLAWSF